MLKEFPVKYKYRFSVKHKRLVDQYKEKHKEKPEVKESQSKKEINKKKELKEKIEVIEQTKSLLKVELISLEKYIRDK